MYVVGTSSLASCFTVAVVAERSSRSAVLPAHPERSHCAHTDDIALPTVCSRDLVLFSVAGADLQRASTSSCCPCILTDRS
jgi:hypothetical protein